MLCYVMLCYLNHTHHPGLGSHDEMRLVENLLHGYNSLIRPVGNLTQTVNVKFGLAMIQLINVVIIVN